VTTISIIVPIYNELHNVHELMRRVLAAPLPKGCRKEIIVVDDGSIDGTVQMLEQYERTGDIKLHKSILNFGKGTALRVGFKYASGEIILVQDGDLEYDPQEYIKVLQPIVDGKADVVYGSRFMGSMEGMDFLHLLANRILTASANVLYSARITDEATAYKAFRKSVLDSLDLKARRFEFCPEVTAKVRRKGIRIHEVPITYNARTVSEGKKIRWLDGVHAIWTLLKWRIF
jgi:dolichol-phosphate mannosyltransferase